MNLFDRDCKQCRTLMLIMKCLIEIKIKNNKILTHSVFGSINELNELNDIENTG